MVVILVPGTGVIYTVSTGLFRGSRASIVAAFGCTLGIVPHLVAMIAGLAALLHVSAVAFQAVKFAGVAYLLYLAWGMWRDTGTIEFDDRGGAKNSRAIVTKGILINILNPKLSIFFLAFIPQFVPTESAAPLARMLVLSAVFMLLTFIVFVGYGLAAHALRTRVMNSPVFMRRAQRSFAATFALLGARLAFEER